MYPKDWCHYDLSRRLCMSSQVFSFPTLRGFGWLKCLLALSSSLAPGEGNLISSHAACPPACTLSREIFDRANNECRQACGHRATDFDNGWMDEREMASEIVMGRCCPPARAALPPPSSSSSLTHPPQQQLRSRTIYSPYLSR